jgi:chromosomal replication initiator protein
MVGDGGAVLSVRTTFARELLESRYRGRIEAAIAEVIGRSCTLEIAVSPTEVAPASYPVMATSRQAHATHPHAYARGDRQPVGLVRPSLFALDGDPLLGHPSNLRGTSPSAAPPSTHRHVSSVPDGASTVRGARARTVLGRARAGVGVSARQRGNSREDTHAGQRAATAIEGTAATEPRRAGQPALARNDTHNNDTHNNVGDLTMSIAEDERGHGTPRNTREDNWRHADLPHEQEAIGLLPDAETAGLGALAAQTMSTPRFNPRYTFATFIVGSANQLAHAASVAVAEAPGHSYNPLFLYGGVGLGKTHLLHAIGHTAVARELRVLYVSSETFTNEIINAIRFRTTEEFRAKYRSVDMLLVDDIQFIAGKDSTEEEFFHTFNSLYETSKQIVICSDRPPKAIVSMEERLRSRFQWGLIADIQPPDLEMRVAILRAKADLLQRVVPDEVLQYLATEVQSNIRELEGSLNRLLAIAQLQGKPLTVETARGALTTLALDGKRRHLGTGEVLAAVSEHYRIPVSDLQGKQRDKHIVVPRQVAMYLMRQETEASLLEIGQALGGRDHSTVLHGCEKIGREINENTALRKEVLAIRQRLFE